jgi:hypothetical protein
MAEKHPKRPRDLNQWAKRMVDIATGAANDEPPEERDKDPAAIARGKARAGALTKERRAEISRNAAKARRK